MNPATWHLVALGKPRLQAPGGQVVRCEVRTLALLTYLALEGPTLRSRLAGLLWPETAEGPARNNLVHLLRRIARATSPDLLRAGESIALGEALSSDLAALVGETGTESGLVDLPMGRLLEGVDLDAFPDLAEVLLAWREKLDGLRAARVAGEADRLEAAGEYALALPAARGLLELDPLSEEVWRRLMRLHYLAGDRPAALRAYQKCQAVLQRELGLTPMPETLALARLIERGSVPAPSAPAPPRIPLVVLRPPVLVGREREWAQMERAWAQGQCILLVGPAGVGKSRLMQEFLASKGAALWLEARPGDAKTPYASTVRMLRRVLKDLPGIMALPEWVWQALQPLLPELIPGPRPEGPQALLVAALHHMYQLAMRDAKAVAFEDLHLTDPASLEVGFALLSSNFPLGQPGGMPHLVCSLRGEELGASHRAMFERFVAAGQAAWIEVEPLTEAQTCLLVESLELPEVRALGQRLARFTGGNPLFVLETLKHVIETGEGSSSQPLPVAHKVSGIIARRLSNLSTGALQVARAAAVLQSDFGLELVAETLGTPLLEVASAWEELEKAQLLSGERFSHELVAETLHGETPEGVRRLLHRAAARALTGQAASGRALPGRIAQHWLEGGDAQQAAPWLIRAGHGAWQAGRQAEAQSFFAQAAAYLEATQPDAAFEALTARAEVLASMSDPGHAAAVQDLHRRALTPLQRATAYAQEYRLQESSFDPVPIEQVVRAGLEALRAAETSREALLVEAQLTEGLALVSFVRGQWEETVAHLNRIAEIGEGAGSPEWQAKAEEGLGLALIYCAPSEAPAHLERAEALHLKRHDFVRAGSSLAKLARVLCELGDGAAAQSAVRRGQAHFRRLDANHGERIALLSAHIMVAQTCGDLACATAVYEAALRDHDPSHSALLGFFPVFHAKTLRLAGEFQAAWQAALAARDGRPFAQHWAALRALEEAAILMALGKADAAAVRLDEAERLLLEMPNVAWQARLHDLRAAHLGEKAGAAHREVAFALRKRFGLPKGHWSAL